MPTIKPNSGTVPGRSGTPDRPCDGPAKSRYLAGLGFVGFGALRFGVARGRTEVTSHGQVRGFFRVSGSIMLWASNIMLQPGSISFNSRNKW